MTGLTFDRFHNALRIMLSIDQHEIGLEADEWETFQRDPFRWFIRASDEDAQKVWAVIRRRQRIPTVETESLAAAYHSGMTFKQVGLQFGIRASTVYLRLREAGFQSRPRGRSPGKNQSALTERNAEIIRRARNGESRTDLAAEFGITRERVRQIAGNAGPLAGKIPSRETAAKRAGIQQRNAERREQIDLRRAERAAKRRAVVAEIVECREAGLTWEKIAQQVGFSPGGCFQFAMRHRPDLRQRDYRPRPKVSA